MKKLSIFFIILCGVGLLAAFVSDRTNPPAKSRDAASATSITGTQPANPPAALISAPTSSEPTATFYPTLQPEQWATFKYEKAWESSEGFVLHYPQSWTFDIQKDQAGRGPLGQQMILTLKKSGYTITIIQGAGSEANCLYPEDPKRDGFFSRYGKYTEIIKSDRLRWRIASLDPPSFDGMYYQVCEMAPDEGYGVAFTSIGSINLHGPTEDAAIFSEFRAILDTIEIIN
jgi:hypothetical protein